MREKILKQLLESKTKTHVVKNKLGKVVFVGTFRQLRKRFQVQFGLGRTPEVLQILDQLGYTIAASSGKLFLNTAPSYNVSMDKLKEKLKDIPAVPGVYQFLDSDGEVLYVGKAKNLKSRVSQYFTNHDNRPQLPYLLREVADIQYTVVSNELESLFLENTLIKKYLPKYNIQLRDDKNYAFITIDYSFQIPQLGYSRKMIADSQSKITNQRSKIIYFGPYSAAWKIRNTLNLVRRIFPYCSNKEVGARPCFYYYLHRCPGVCIGKISLAEYNEQLERIVSFLSGSTTKLKSELETEMAQAASSEKFETAARLRDQIQALELLDEKQIAIQSKPVSWDTVSVFTDQGYVCVNLFKVREGKIVDKENFVYELGFESNAEQVRALSEETLQKFLEQYYLEASSVPQTVYTEPASADSELIEHIIKSRFGKKTEVSTAVRGKPAELVKLGVKNAEEYLKNWLKSQAGHLDAINTALSELKKHLALEKIPERIECYDISNIQGTNPVGSMVVFEKGLPKKSEYRKFKIQGKKTPDDFAMMKEMLARRLQRIKNLELGIKEKQSWPEPDLIVIDGGKGQLNAALEVLSKYQKPNTKFQVIGLAKRIEEIFVPGNKESIVLPLDNPGLQLLQRIRDEAHRYGITFHRDLRSKQAVRSALDNIPGVGPKTKKLLKQKFGTVAQIRKTKFEDLAAVVGERIAHAIQQSL